MERTPDGERARRSCVGGREKLSLSVARAKSRHMFLLTGVLRLPADVPSGVPMVSSVLGCRGPPTSLFTRRVVEKVLSVVSCMVRKKLMILAKRSSHALVHFVTDLAMQVTVFKMSRRAMLAEYRHCFKRFASKLQMILQLFPMLLFRN